MLTHSTDQGEMWWHFHICSCFTFKTHRFVVRIFLCLFLAIRSNWFDWKTAEAGNALPLVSINVCCTSYYKLWLWGSPPKQLSQLTFISVPSHIHLIALISHTVSQHCLHTLKGTQHFLRTQRYRTESFYEMFCFVHLHVCSDFCYSRVSVFIHLFLPHACFYH